MVLFALESPSLMFQRGFYCNDESIRYPYREDTISIGMLVAVGLLVPIVTVSLPFLANVIHQLFAVSLVTRLKRTMAFSYDSLWAYYHLDL